MKIIDLFEKKINKTVRSLEKKDIEILLKNEEIMSEYFINPDHSDELFNEIINRNDKPEVKEVISLMKYSFQLIRYELEIDRVFSDYREKKIDRTILLEEMQRMRKSTEAILVVSAALCSMIALPDIDLQIEEENISNGIGGIKNIFSSLGDMKDSYVLRRDLLDLIYQLREWYFSKYEKDLLKDETWVNDELSKLNNFESSLLEDIPDINVKPEALGFIDITKLKGRSKDGKSN